jgi:hypothetical protein
VNATAGEGVGEQAKQRPASSTEEAEPLPPQSRNRIGRHTGWVTNGSATTIPAMIHQFPRPSFAGPGDDPSWVQNA